MLRKHIYSLNVPSILAPLKTLLSRSCSKNDLGWWRQILPPPPGLLLAPSQLPPPQLLVLISRPLSLFWVRKRKLVTVLVSSSTLKKCTSFRPSFMSSAPLESLTKSHRISSGRMREGSEGEAPYLGCSNRDLYPKDPPPVLRSLKRGLVS